jgi:signal transduction histidine kinase
LSPRTADRRDRDAVRASGDDPAERLDAADAVAPNLVASFLDAARRIRSARDDGRSQGSVAVRTQDLVSMCEELERMRSLLRVATDTSPMAIHVMSGPDRRTEYINGTFTELFGYGIDDLPTVTDWLARAYPDTAYRAGVERGLGLGGDDADELDAPPLETIVVAKDGSTKEIFWEVSRRGTMTVAHGLDLTRRRAEEREIREINAQLAEANAAKSAFLANMSHELRTPLNSVIGFAGILQSGLAGPLNDEQARQLGMIRSSGSHLLELINQVLDLAKIEAGHLDIEMAPMDVAEMVNRVLDSVAPLAESNRVKLTFELDSSVGCIVSNYVRVEQVLLNLVGNAVKFTSDGAVAVRVMRERDHVVLSVTDTGAGIPECEIPRIFDEFYQVECAAARQSQGTGLGLSVSRSLVAALGGTIEVTSRLGHGSTFAVKLPYGKCPQDA